MSSVDTEELENSQFLSMRDSTVPIPVDNFFTAQILISNDLFMDTIIFREDNHTYRILNYSNSLDAIRSDGIILKNVPTGFFRERTDVLQLPVGSRVLVCRTKKPYWKIGEISGFSDDFYVVLYDDNEYEYNVNAMNVISLFIPLQYYSLNQNVLAKFNYHSSWLPAKILSLDLQNRYTLKFDNGVVKSEFHANYIKPNFVKKPVVFQTQDRVEVLYLNSKYYSVNNRYTILYDDNELEQNVEPGRIKRAISPNIAYKIGDVIEVFDKSKFAIGRIEESLSWGRYLVYFNRKYSATFHSTFFRETKEVMPIESKSKIKDKKRNSLL